MTVQKLSVGLLVFIAILYLMYVAIQFRKRHVLGAGGYVVYADFISASGLRVGDPVEVVGVEIGTLESISLATDYQALVDLRIKDDVTIYRDRWPNFHRCSQRKTPHRCPP